MMVSVLGSTGFTKKKSINYHNGATSIGDGDGEGWARKVYSLLATRLTTAETFGLLVASLACHTKHMSLVTCQNTTDVCQVGNTTSNGLSAAYVTPQTPQV